MDRYLIGCLSSIFLFYNDLTGHQLVNIFRIIVQTQIKHLFMNYQKYIERNPDILLGKPIIKGTRISVELIMRKLSNGYETDDLLDSYPHLEREQILAALEYAADMIANEENLEPV